MAAPVWQVQYVMAAGEDHGAALATSGSTRSRRMPTPYRYLRCGDLRSPGFMEWRNGPLRLRDNDDDDDDDYALAVCWDSIEHWSV